MVAMSFNRKASETKTIFKPNSWLAQIDFINQMVLSDNRLIAILAEQGSGKTTFARLLQTRLDNSIKASLIKLSNSGLPEHFIEQLSESFQFGEEISNLLNMMHCVSKLKIHHFVIIDDAHLISPDLLRELLRVLREQGKKSYLHFCLISNASQLTEQLNSLTTFADLIYRLRPGTLTERETGTYVLNNLPVSKRLTKAITGKRLIEFYKHTGGDIAAINQQMTVYFNSRTRFNLLKRQIIVKPFSLVAGIAAVFIITTYVWQGQESTLPAKQLPPQQDLPENTTVLSKKIIDTVLEVQEKYKVPLAAKEQKKLLPKSLSPNLQKNEKSISPTLVLSQKNAHALGTINLIPTSGSDSYTIQLAACQNFPALRQFMQSHILKNHLQIWSTQREGVNWYVLTLGKFPEKRQARLAAGQLPKEFAQFKPWIRPVKELVALG